VSLLVVGAVDPGAPLARRNASAKLLASFLLMLGLLLSSDPVTPAVVIAVLLAAVPATGLGPRGLLRRTWPLLLSAAGVGFANAMLAHRPTGRVLLDAGPFDMTTGSLAESGTVVLRVVAVALPGILVVATTDPVDLADSLVQQARVPARFAYGALAALRLLPLLQADWRSIARARRARGLDAGRNPLAAARLFAGQVFALLVAAVRRGVRLATAMDARGFDAGRPRSIARPQVVTGADRLLVAAAAVLVAAAVTVSVAAGQWELVTS
jgi:energy-coupling factor transport system permease protein